MAGALAGEPSDVTRRLLDGLRRAHLIESAAGPGRYRFHDLLLLYARECCAPDECEPAIDRLLAWYRSAAITEVERPNFVAVSALGADTGHDEDVLNPYISTCDRLTGPWTITAWHCTGSSSRTRPRALSR